jgi:diadenosine tetraphosphate (Ap4A) HIT family hydrolase
MTQKCAFCYRTDGSPAPVKGWVEAVQGYLDYQPHPGRVDGIIECDRRVFEDDGWFCVVEREPLAEGHVRLYCKHHVANLSELRGGASTDEQDPSDIEAARSNLLDDLQIAHDAVMAYDERVVGAVVLAGTVPGSHLHFDIVPMYRFDEPSLHALGDRNAHWDDISLPEKRRYWTEHMRDFDESASRLRDAADRVIHARPGRRRAGLMAGDETAPEE